MSLLILLRDSEVAPLTYTFCPPIRGYTDKWNKETPANERRFLSHWIGAPRAVNVYELLDGSFSEEEGLPPASYMRVFRGSTCVEVDSELAARLIAAGYEVEEL